MNELKILQSLKNSVLSLAMQGKLVKQDDNDEPAIKLLEKIKNEKEELLKQGKLKKEKPLPPISEDEIPYELPKSWQWVRLGEVFLIERGSSPRPISKYITDDKNAINWIKIGDAKKGSKYITETKEKITREGARHSRFVQVGDFIFSNSMSFGRPYILKIDGCIHDGWNVLKFIHITINNIKTSIFPDYLYYTIISPLIQNYIKYGSNGGIVENFKSDNLKHVFFPLPPLAEQERIVAKIEEIFALIEETEKNINENKKLSKVLYNKLLSLAMQGKLVKQDDNDEPAIKLLEKIKNEKEELLKQGKLKKEKPLPPISEDEIPYELPKSWQWVRLGEVCEIIRGNGLTKKDFTKVGVPCIHYGQIHKYFNHFTTKTITFTSEILARKLKKVEYGNIIMVITSENMEDVCKSIAWLGCETIVTGSHTVIIKHIFNPLYLVFLFESNVFQKQKNKIGKGMKVIEVSSEMLKTLLIPLPPLAEQERIVAKIEEIKEIIDELG